MEKWTRLSKKNNAKNSTKKQKSFVFKKWNISGKIKTRKPKKFQKNIITHQDEWEEKRWYGDKINEGLSSESGQNTRPAHFSHRDCLESEVFKNRNKKNSFKFVSLISFLGMKCLNLRSRDEILGNYYRKNCTTTIDEIVGNVELMTKREITKIFFEKIFWPPVRGQLFGVNGRCNDHTNLWRRARLPWRPAGWRDNLARFCHSRRMPRPTGATWWRLLTLPPGGCGRDCRWRSRPRIELRIARMSTSYKSPWTTQFLLEPGEKHMMLLSTWKP